MTEKKDINSIGAPPSEILNEASGGTNAVLMARIKELEALVAEEKSLEIEERKLNVELKRTQVAKQKQERETRIAQAEMARIQLAQQLAAQEALQNQCTHMKGGTVTQSDASIVMNGHGTDSADYCVIKHMMPWGSLHILCVRCLKEWHGFNRMTGEKETPGFQEARRWPTKNIMSASSMFVPVRPYHLNAEGKAVRVGEGI